MNLLGAYLFLRNERMVHEDIVLADAGKFIGKVIVNSDERGYQDLTSLLGWFIGMPSIIRFFLLILLLVFYGERFSLTLLPACMLGAVWALSHSTLRRTRMWQTVPVRGVVLLLALRRRCTDRTHTIRR